MYIITAICDPPSLPNNGNLGNYSSTIEMDNVTFYCDEGYVPSIIRTATCNSSGMWSPAPEEHNCTPIEGIHLI